MSLSEVWLQLERVYYRAISIGDFERWLYDSADVDAVLGEGLSLSLLEFNYSQPEALRELRLLIDGIYEQLRPEGRRLGVNEVDEEARSLAKGILEGSIDKIDGLWELGGCIQHTRFFTPGEFGVLVDVSDALEGVPLQAHRSQWNEMAYTRGRARGDEVLAQYAEDVDRALQLVLIRSQEP